MVVHVRVPVQDRLGFSEVDGDGVVLPVAEAVGR